MTAQPRHLRPPDPALLVQTGEECPGWSKPATNAHGVSEYVCKCGRAKIVKVERRGLQAMFLPILDDGALPPYFKLGEAKEAIEAVARGEQPPKMSRPKRRPLEYRNVGEEQGAASYEQTKAWFSARVTGVQETADQALTVLGLEPGATEAEIKSAFRRLTLQFHPDRNPGDEEAAARFREITEAAEKLLEAV